MGNKHSRRHEGEVGRVSRGCVGEKVIPPPTPKRSRTDFHAAELDEVCRLDPHTRQRITAVERTLDVYVSERVYFEQYARAHPAFHHSVHYECREATFPNDDYVVAMVTCAVVKFKENAGVVDELSALRHTEGTVFSHAHVDALLHACENALRGLEAAEFYLAVLLRMISSMRVAFADFMGVDRRSEPLQGYINQCRANVHVESVPGG